MHPLRRGEGRQGRRVAVGIERHQPLDLASATRPARPPRRDPESWPAAPRDPRPRPSPAGVATRAAHPRRRRSMPHSVHPAENRVQHRDRGDEVRDQRAARHLGQRLEVHEARVAHVHARRLRGAVREHEAAELSARRLHRRVCLARRDAEALGDELEVVDQRLHRGSELVPRRQRDLAVGRDVRPLGQPVERLLDDPERLAPSRRCARGSGRSCRPRCQPAR